MGGAAESLPGIGGVSAARCTGHPLPHSSPSPVPARIADPAPAGGGPRRERRPGEHGPRRGMRISRGKKNTNGVHCGRGAVGDVAGPAKPPPRRSLPPGGPQHLPAAGKAPSYSAGAPGHLPRPAAPSRSLAAPSPWPSRRGCSGAPGPSRRCADAGRRGGAARLPGRAGRPRPPPPPRGERPAVARRCSGPGGPAAAPRRRDRRPWRCLLLPGKVARAAASRQRGARGDRISARQAPRRQGGRRAQAPGRLGHAPDADGAARGRRSWGRR